MKRVDKAKCIRNVIKRCKDGSKELENDKLGIGPLFLGVFKNMISIKMGMLNILSKSLLVEDFDPSEYDEDPNAPQFIFGNTTEYHLRIENLDTNKSKDFLIQEVILDPESMEQFETEIELLAEEITDALKNQDVEATQKLSYIKLTHE